MRVAIVTESYLPTVNGVTGTVVRAATHLTAQGHEVLVVAPEGAGAEAAHPWTVVRAPAVTFPGYRGLPVGVPTARLSSIVTAFAPDVVHAAGPIALGAWGVGMGRRLGVPVVAVYQTDFAGFAAHYGLRPFRGFAWRWLRRLHEAADRTLAPSSSALWELKRHGVPRVHLWPRGVDGALFDPARRCRSLRDQLAPGGEVLVGYVGRLAAEKGVERLLALRGIPGVRVVVVGDGPERARLQRALPGAAFLGFLGGAELARAFASLDVFVHTGAHETFCQTVQEALASGVPAVVPACGGPLDLVSHRGNGLLYDPDAAGALEEAVGALAADQRLRRDLARAARPSVAGRTWHAVGDALLGHYAAVHGTPGRTRELAA